MTSEVDWVLSQFKSVADAQPSDNPLKRIDRDDSEILEDAIHKHSADLQVANYVGATYATRVPTPIGAEYDHSIETVVGVRIEGAHHSEFGHIDPDGTNGVVWSTLVDDLRGALESERTYPAAGDADTTYTHLTFANESDQSSNYSDYYRRDFDVVFHGFEDLS